MGCGIFSLVSYVPQLEEIFKNRYHLVWFHTPDEAIELIRYYLSHSEEREKIARQGQEEVYKNHTYDVRVKEMFNIVINSNQRSTRIAKRAERYTEEGKFNLAKRIYEEALKTDLNHPNLYYKLGYPYQRMGLLDEAMRCYERALKLDPEFDLSYIRMGEIHSLIGRFDEAIHFYKRSIATTKEYEEIEIDCPSCSSNEKDTISARRPLLSTTYGVINPLRRWVRCKRCGLIYVNPAPSPSALKEYYRLKAKSEEGEVINLWLTRKDKEVNLALERFGKISEYMKKGNLLEIGAGIGTNVRVAEKIGWRVKGVELSKANCGFAEAYLDVSLIEGNIEELDLEDKFDVITMWGLLEHLRNPFKIFSKIRRLLIKDGIVALSITNADSFYHRFWLSAGHLYLFPKGLLCSHLEGEGFKILETRSSLIKDNEEIEIFAKKIK
jgi:tetratricopeptide (TPR) repeat protein